MGDHSKQVWYFQCVRAHWNLNWQTLPYILPGYTEKHKKEITMLSTSANIVSKIHVLRGCWQRETWQDYWWNEEERCTNCTQKGSNISPALSVNHSNKKNICLVELMMVCFQRGGNLVVPSSSGGAVHYGGASFDAMDAWKYIGGKTAMLPPGS